MSDCIGSRISALYADPSDPVFIASGVPIPTLAEMQEVFAAATAWGMADTARIAAIEIARLSGSGDAEVHAAIVFGNSAGLWRLH